MAYKPDILTTKGDLLAHNGTQEIRLGTGSGSDFLIITDSTEETGMKWISVASMSVESASYALTASYASNSLTASYALNVDRTLLMDSASYALNVDRTLLMDSSSYSLLSLTSSYSEYALTASYASNVPVTASYALQSLTASFAENAGAGVWVNTGSSAVLLSPNELNLQTYELINVAWPTAVSSSATKGYVDGLVSAASGGDMLKSVYDPTNQGYVDSASYAITASYALNASVVISGTPYYIPQFNVTGDGIEDSIAWITGSDTFYVSGALEVITEGVNVFGDELTDQHEFTGSVWITGSLWLNGEAVGGSSETASYALDVDRSLLMDSSSYSLLAETASYYDLPEGVISGSLIDSASYVTDPNIAYINKTNQFSTDQNITGSLLLSGSVGTNTGLFFGNGDTGIYEYSDDSGALIANGTNVLFWRSASIGIGTNGPLHALDIDTPTANYIRIRSTSQRNGGFFNITNATGGSAFAPIFWAKSTGGYPGTWFLSDTETDTGDYPYTLFSTRLDGVAVPTSSNKLLYAFSNYTSHQSGGTYSLTIDAKNRVGVGGIIYPSHSLDVDGDSMFRGTASYDNDYTSLFQDNTLITKGWVDSITSSLSVETASYVTDPNVAYINKNNFFTTNQSITGSIYLLNAAGSDVSTIGTDAQDRLEITAGGGNVEVFSHLWLQGTFYPYAAGTYNIGTDTTYWSSLYLEDLIQFTNSGTQITSASEGLTFKDGFGTYTLSELAASSSYAVTSSHTTDPNIAYINKTNQFSTDQNITGSLLLSGSLIGGAGLYFGDGDTGIYESADDSLTISLASSKWIFVGNNIRASNSSGAWLLNAAASSTLPTLGPNFNDTNTGIGSAGSETGSLISNGINVLNWYASQVDITGDQNISGNLTVDGNLTANQFIISSSVTYMTQSFSSGSTMFGDSIDDTHIFTGSVYITGSLVVNGEDLDNLENVAYINKTNQFSENQNITGSLLLSGSFTLADGGLKFGDGDTGIYELSDDQLEFQIAGTNRMLLDETRLSNQGYTNGWLLRNVNSTATIPSYAYASDYDTGVGRAGVNTGSLIAGGVNVLNWNSSGFVGIGTQDPSAPLEIISTGTEQARFSDGNNVTQVSIGDIGGSSGIWFNNTTNLRFRTVASVDLEFAAQETSESDVIFRAYQDVLFRDQTSAEKVRFEMNTGYVGIGTNAPSYSLDVSGSTRFGIDQTSVLYTTGSAYHTGSTNHYGKFTVIQDAGVTNDSFNIERPEDSAGLAFEFWSSGGSFDVRNNAGASTVRIRSYQSANTQAYFSLGGVAIGRTIVSHSVDLDVDGSSRFGMTVNDNHWFTGSLHISGSLIVNEDTILDLENIAYTNKTNYFTGSQYITGSLDTTDYIKVTGTNGDYSHLHSSGLIINAPTYSYPQFSLINSDGNWKFQMNPGGDFSIQDMSTNNGIIQLYEGAEQGSIRVHNNNVLLAQGSGSVGIGINNPQAKLHISGGIGDLSTGLSFGDGDTGIYESTDDTIFFDLAGSNRWRFTGDEFYPNNAFGVSIRTVTPSSTSPGLAFHTDLDTGIGHAGDDTGSLIAGGTNVVNWYPGYVDITGTTNITGNLNVDGNLTANQFIVSSSVTYMTQSFSSGSTMFGDSIDDTHIFTGSIYVTNSINLDGDLVINGTTIGDLDNVAYINKTNQFSENQNITGSLLLSGSFTLADGGLKFGDGDTGIYESADDTLNFSISGTNKVAINAGSMTNQGYGSGWLLLNGNTSATTPGFTFANDTTTGMGRGGASTGSLIAGGTNVLNWNSAGYVGIGTQDPKVKLHVDGGGDTITDTVPSSVSMLVQGNGHGQLAIMADDDAQSIVAFGDVGDYNAGNLTYYNDTHKFSFRTNNVSDRVVIDSGGRVGIGTNVPSSSLHVMTNDGGLTNILTLSGNRNQSETELGILFKDRNSVIVGGDNAARIYSLRSSTNDDFGLRFQTAESHVLSDVMTLTHKRDVGINTTNPERLLDVSGSSIFRGTASYDDDYTSLFQEHTLVTKGWVDSISGSMTVESASHVTDPNVVYATSSTTDNQLAVFNDDRQVMGSDNLTWNNSSLQVTTLSHQGHIVRRGYNTVGWGVGTYYSLLNSNSDYITYASVIGSIVDNTDGAEYGKIAFQLLDSGSIGTKSELSTTYLSVPGLIGFGNHGYGNQAVAMYMTASYIQDFKDLYNDRTLVDKGYVDSVTGSLGGGSTIGGEIRFSTTLTGDPGTGKFAYDDVNPESASILRINYNTSTGVDMTSILGSLTGNDHIYFQETADHASFGMYKLTAAGTDQTTYIDLPVTHVDSGDAFGNNDKCTMLMFFSHASATSASYATLAGSANFVTDPTVAYQNKSNYFTGSQFVDNGHLYVRNGLLVLNDEGSWGYATTSNPLIISANTDNDGLFSCWGDLYLASNGITYISGSLIKYDTDKSSTYDNRSLVDKGWVDSITGSLELPENLAYTNVNNQFSEDQTITGSLLLSGSYLFESTSLKFGNGDHGIYHPVSGQLAFVIDGSHRATISALGYIGGTNATGKSLLTSALPTATVPGHSFVSDTGTGVGRAGLYTGSLIAGGVNVMNWTSEGYVGIGTQDPSHLLHIFGTTQDVLKLETNTASVSTEIDFSSIGGTALFQLDYTGNMVFRTFQGGLYFDNNGSGDIDFRTDSQTNRIKIKSDGKVGIGTTSPAYLFEVSGSSMFRETASYDTDFSSDYTDRTLVDKGWVDSITGSLELPENLAYTNVNNYFETDQSVTGSVYITQDLVAATKSFLIDHPDPKKKGKLQYGSVESPEHSIMIRGRIDNTNIIKLPDYWPYLVDDGTITVQLTSINKWQRLYVKEIVNNTIVIGKMGFGKIHCFYTAYAERKDVPKLQVERLDGYM